MSFFPCVQLNVVQFNLFADGIILQIIVSIATNKLFIASNGSVKKQIIISSNMLPNLLSTNIGLILCLVPSIVLSIQTKYSVKNPIANVLDWYFAFMQHLSNKKINRLLLTAKKIFCLRLQSALTNEFLTINCFATIRHASIFPLSTEEI